MANSSDSAHTPPVGAQIVPEGPISPPGHEHAPDFERILQALLRVDPSVRLVINAAGEIRTTCETEMADAVEAALKTALTLKPLCPLCAVEFDRREKSVRRLG